MFKNNKSTTMAENTSFDTNAIDRIAEGTTFEGNILSSKGMRIDGTVKGSIKCEGKIVVGKSGLVEGEIECGQADIEGTLKSSIKVEDLLELKATSSLYGEIITGRLSIEAGATFTGNSNMGGVVKGFNKEENQETPEEKTAEEKTA